MVNAIRDTIGRAQRKRIETDEDTPGIHSLVVIASGTEDEIRSSVAVQVVDRCKPWRDRARADSDGKIIDSVGREAQGPAGGERIGQENLGLGHGHLIVLCRQALPSSGCLQPHFGNRREHIVHHAKWLEEPLAIVARST
jgi:hypothetical protein